MPDYPPDDFTLKVELWLKDEVYPGLLQEPYDDRARAVWLHGSNGFVGRWVRGDHAKASPQDRVQLIQHDLFRDIEQIKRQRDAAIAAPPQPSPEPGADSGPAPGPSPAPGPDHPSALKGRLRYSVGGLWQDDNGPVVPMFCHFMEAFSAWCHGKRDAVRDQCVRIAAAGYQGIRALDVLGYYDSPGGWLGKEIAPITFRAKSGRTIPATTDFYGQKRAFLEMLHGLGLKVMDDRGDLNTWSSSQKLEHMRKNGELYASMGDVGRNVLAGLWACNESWQNGVPDHNEAAKMLDAFRSGSGGWWPDTRGLSWGAKDGNWTADPTGELPDSMIWWSIDPATVITEHGSRTAAREHIIAHYLGYGYYDDTLKRRGKRCWNTEPIGGGQGVTVGRVDDAEKLTGIATEAVMSGQAWTFMSGAGVFWDRPIENEPGFRATANLLKWLPRDLHTFGTIGHSGTRYAGTRIVAAVDRPPTRADYAIHRDGRFVINVFGEHAPLPFEKACAECRVIDVANDRIQSEGPRRAGDRFTESYTTCRLVVGKLA